MRYAKTLSCLVAMLVVSQATAQRLPLPDPVLEVGGPTVVEVGKKCVLKAATTAKKVTWKIPAGCDTEALDGRRLAVWALPGTYTFVAMVPSGDDVVSIDYVLTVTGARPPPPPPPPVVGKLYGWVLLEESSQAWPTRGKALADSIAWSDTNGIKHRVFDTSQAAPADIAPYLAKAAGKPLPHLFAVTDKGEILFDGPAPKTATGILDTLKPLKGN